MATEQRAYSDLAIPPGEYLLEVIEEKGLRQTDLSRRMGRPVQAINEIVNGEKAITPETAIQLEQVVGVPAHIWTGLESEYQLALARQGEQASLRADQEIARSFPYSELSKLGHVANTRAPLERVGQLRRFFGVASLALVPGLAAYQPAFRAQQGVKKSPEALAAWLRAGAIRAEVIEVQTLNLKGLRDALPRLRAMTNSDAKGLADELVNFFAEFGVSLVLLKHFRGTRANGATFWLSPSRPVLMLSLRGSWTDIVWFSLFHEVGHLLRHGKRTVFVDEDGGSIEDLDLARQEEEANEFARDALVPPAAYGDFVAVGDFWGTSIRAFAQAQGVHPGIVVGRLQREGFLDYSQQNNLRAQYKWVER